MCPASPQLSRLPGPAGKTVGPSALAELALSCPDSSGLCLHTASPCSSRCSRLVLPPAPPLSPPSDLLWCGLEQGLQENDLFSNRCIHEKKISHTLTCIFFLTRSCGSVFREGGAGERPPQPGSRGAGQARRERRPQPRWGAEPGAGSRRWAERWQGGVASPGTPVQPEEGRRPLVHRHPERPFSKISWDGCRRPRMALRHATAAPVRRCFSAEMDAPLGALVASGVFSAFGACLSDQKETPSLPSLCVRPLHSAPRARRAWAVACTCLSLRVLSALPGPAVLVSRELFVSSVMRMAWVPRVSLSHRVSLWRRKQRRRPRGRQSPACAPGLVTGVVAVVPDSAAAQQEGLSSRAQSASPFERTAPAASSRDPQAVAATRQRGRLRGPHSLAVDGVRPRHSLARSSEETVARGLEGFVNCCYTVRPGLKSSCCVGP